MHGMAQKSILIWAGLLLTLLTRSGSCDYYTSVAGLDELLAVEGFMVQFFEDYMVKVETRNLHIEKFLTATERVFLKIEKDPLSFYGNPITAFKTIRRIVIDWSHLAELVLSAQEAEAYKRSVENIETEYTKPNALDLTGAVKGMLRLQETYTLAAAELANGTLADVKYSADLTTNDCFHMGSISYELQRYHYAVEWLIEARIRLEEEIATASSIWELPSMTEYYKILEYLATSMSNLGNHKLAYRYNSELLALDPANQYALQHKEIYKRKLQLPRFGIAPDSVIRKAPKTKTQQLYEQLCREEQLRTPAEERDLRCRYVNNNVPFCLIAPFRMEELSQEPFVAYYHEAINEREIGHILNITEYSVERSKVGDAVVSDFSDIRTSKDTWLWFDEHSFLHEFQQRMKDISGLNMESAEPLQVVNYGIGGHYEPHFDFADREVENTFPGKGNRILTALLYLNDVELGGSTVFPFLRLSVPPVRRSLVVWHNMHESSELDYRTLHAGCPVLKGSKWIGNQWLHEIGQEFKRPCSLEQMGHKSIEYKLKL